MDKKAVDRSLKVIKARFADFIELIKNNKRFAAIIAAAVLVVAAVMGIICASCSASKKNEEPSTNEPNSVAAVVTTAAQDTTPKANGQGKYKVTLDNSVSLNLRLVPSATSSDTKVIATIPKNTELDVMFVYNNWGFVEYDGFSGWVSMEYLTPIS